MVSCNKKFYELLNFEGDDFSDMNAETWREIVHEDDADVIPTNWRVLTEEKRRVTFEYRTKRIWRSYDQATKTEIEGPTWLRANAFPDLDRFGAVKTVMGWLTDISLQKWSEGIQAKRLEEALEAKKNANNFIDMTRYLLRTPSIAFKVCCINFVTI